MSDNTREVFPIIEELAWENSHLLPQDKRKIIYFVTAMQGKDKKIVYIGYTKNLRRRFLNHHRKIEFEFLNRMGYQINIFGTVLPEAISDKEAHSVQDFYIQAFQPKLNDDYNTLVFIQNEQLQK